MSERTKPEPSTEAHSSSADLIERYHETKALYEKLADEIAFSLEKRLKERNIPFAHLSKRVKTFKSFIEKLERKRYDDPWKGVTDVAGVRVVFLYPSTRGQIESVIENEFKVIEKVDKLADLEDDQFGYGALHYLVHLGEKTSGARYEDLKDLVCEIQVRTVMQDAWAIIQHHLVYKSEFSVPSKLKRRLSTFSGMFENIDEQFDNMRSEREAYATEVAQQSKKVDNFLNQEINFETMKTYVIQRFPKLKYGSRDSHIDLILKEMHKYSLKKLADVERLLKLTERANEAMSAEIAPVYGIAQVARAMALKWPEFRVTGWENDYLSAFKKHEHLVEKT